MTRPSRDEQLVRDEVRRHWGDALVRVPPETVSDQGVSAELVAFLTEVGLPIAAQNGITFYRDERLLEVVPIAGVDFHRIADEPGAVLGLRSGSDELWAVDPDHRLPPRFVNSSISLFLLFLRLFDESRSDLLNAAREEDYQSIIDQLHQCLADRDPRALEDSRNWWSIALEEAEEGY